MILNTIRTQPQTNSKKKKKHKIWSIEHKILLVTSKTEAKVLSKNWQATFLLQDSAVHLASFLLNLTSREAKRSANERKTLGYSTKRALKPFRSTHLYFTLTGQGRRT